MILLPQYKPLFYKAPEKRYYLITGGRGSAKSFHISMALLNISYLPNEVILFTRWTMTSAGISIIPEFIEKIELLNKTEDFHITKSEIINLKSGSRIIFRGLMTSRGTATASLKSITGVTRWCCDEAEEIPDSKIFTDIDLSIRVPGQTNTVYLVLNPSHKEHWIYKKYFEKIINEVCYIHTTYLDNIKNLNETFINTANKFKENDLEGYNHHFLGHWKQLKDGIKFADRFDQNKHVANVEYNPNAEIWVSFDCNKSPYCFIFAQAYYTTNGFALHVLEEVSLKTGSTIEAIEWIKANEFYISKRHLFRITGDYTGKSGNAAFRGNKNHFSEILTELNIGAGQMSITPNRPHYQSRNDCNHILFYDWFDVKIDPKCKMLINDLQNVEYDEQKKSIIKEDRTDIYQQADLLDTFRYLVLNSIIKKGVKDLHQKTKQLTNF
jgi:PBSX family phage terminase large subunit